MKAASISEIKSSLKNQTQTQLTELCLRLARFKKENKELLTFLLFEADDIDAYIANIKKETEESFSGINTSNLYWAKKSLRKILRTINRYIKYTSSKTAEVELLLHFCTTLKNSKIKYHKSTALLNLYNAQIKKIHASINLLHEDLQYEYKRELEKLTD